MKWILDSLSSLCEEVKNRNHYVEGNALVDAPVYNGRYLLLVSLISVYWLWNEEEKWIDDGHKEFVREFIPTDIKKLQLWGEGCVPQFLAYLWCLRSLYATSLPETNLMILVSSVVRACCAEDSDGLASPYYRYEDVVRRQLGQILGLREDPFRGDTFRLSSFTAEGLLHLLVRTNLKRQCKLLWPQYSKIGAKQFVPQQPWMFCVIHSDKGEEVTVQAPNEKKWKDLVHEARDALGEGIPKELKDNPILLLLFTLVFPYRATPSAIRYLGMKLNKGWFISPPITSAKSRPENK